MGGNTSAVTSPPMRDQMAADTEQVRHHQTTAPVRAESGGLEIWVRLILLAAAYLASGLFNAMGPDVPYFTVITLLAIMLLMTAFFLRRSDKAALGGIAVILDLAWVSFALYFTGGPDSSLIPLVYAMVVLTCLRRHRFDMGVALGGAVVGIFTIGWVWQTHNAVMLNSAATHAALLGAVSIVAYMYADWMESEGELAAATAHSYRELLGHVAGAVISTDSEWNILELDETGSRMLGISEPEQPKTGRHLFDLLRPKYPADVEALIAQVAVGHSAAGVPFWVQNGYGGQRCVRLSAVPVFSNHHQSSIQIVLDDVTDIERARQALAEAEKYPAIEQVVANITHELNNPLAAIRLTAEMAALTNAEPDWDDIVVQVDRCDEIIKSLRVYTAPPGEATAAADVADVLQHAVLLSRPQLIAAGVELTTDLEPLLPLVTVNPYSLQRAFLHIINNARQAMEHSEAQRRLHISARSDSQFVRMEFNDVGPGISEINLEAVFDPFFTTRNSNSGVGMGLTIVRDLMRKVDGEVTVANTSQGGTAVTLRLPLSNEQ